MFTSLLSSNKFVFQDNFIGDDGSTPNLTYWEIISTDISQGTPLIYSNSLRFYHPAGSSATPMVRSNFYLSGDFNIEIPFSIQLPDPSADQQNLYLNVIDDSANVISIIRTWWDGEGGKIQYRYFENAINEATNEYVDPGVESGIINMWRTNGVFNGRIWNPITDDWTALDPGGNIINSDDVKVRLFMTTGPIAYPISQLVISQFTVNSGTLVWP